MTKIYCADVSCKYANSKGICTQKEIGLGWKSVMTVWEGRQEFNKCKMYEKSDDAKRIEKLLENTGFAKREQKW